MALFFLKHLCYTVASILIHLYVQQQERQPLYTVQAVAARSSSHFIDLFLCITDQLNNPISIDIDSQLRIIGSCGKAYQCIGDLEWEDRIQEGGEEEAQSFLWDGFYFLGIAPRGQDYSKTIIDPWPDALAIAVLGPEHHRNKVYGRVLVRVPAQ